MIVDRHVHTLQRFSAKAGSAALYRCADPNCTWFTHKRALVIGKTFRCPKCKANYVIDQYAIRRKNPVCENCRVTLDKNKLIQADLTETMLLKLLKEGK